MPNFENNQPEVISNQDLLLDEYSKLLAGRKEEHITDPVVLAKLDNLKQSLKVAKLSEANTNLEIDRAISRAEEGIEAMRSQVQAQPYEPGPDTSQGFVSEVENLVDYQTNHVNEKNALIKILSIISSMDNLRTMLINDILPNFGITQYKIISTELDEVSQDILENLKSVNKYLSSGAISMSQSEQYLTIFTDLKQRLLGIFLRAKDILRDK